MKCIDFAKKEEIPHPNEYNHINNGINCAYFEWLGFLFKF